MKLRYWVLGLLVLLFLINSVLAAEWDNRDTYNEGANEYTVRNLLGLGRVLATVKLDTPHSLNVIDRGEGIKQLVGEFTINSTGRYANALRNMQFYNVQAGHREFDREFEYRKKVYFDVNKIDYVEECDVRNVGNGTQRYNCQLVENGSHTETRYRWEAFNKKNLNKEVITLGVFLDVKRGETGDWIPTFYGRRLDRWAEWTGSLNVGLVAYYNFTGFAESRFGGDRNLTQGSGSPIFVANASTFELNNNFSGYSSNSSTWNVTANAIFNYNETDEINISFAGWVKKTTADSSFLGKGDSSVGWDLAWRATNIIVLRSLSVDQLDGTLPLVVNQWHHVAITRNDTSTCLYINGTFDVCEISRLSGNTTNSLQFGGVADSDEMGGYIDEWGFWNRTISPAEIGDLFNNGTGISFLPDDNPVITLVSPLSQNFTTSPQSLEFSANASDDLEVINISLYLDNILNQTLNGTGDNNLTFNQTLSLGDGNHEYNFSVEDGFNPRQFSLNQHILIDSIEPDVNITFPPTIIEFAKVDDSLVVNYTVNDTNLDSCVLKYGGVNTTLTCGVNTTINVDTVNNSVTVTANDTIGNENNSTIGFSFSLLEINASNFQDNVLEGSTNEFRANVTFNDTDFTSISANIFYNGTSNSGTKSAGTHNLEFSANISAALVDAENNVSFYWEIKLTNSSGTTPFNLTIGNQSVLAIGSDTCGVFTVLFINYSLVDEGTQVGLNASLHNTSVEFDLQMFALDSNDPILNVSGNFSENNNPQICLENDLGTGSFRIDLLTTYGGDGFTEEAHHIQNATITNSSLPQNIGLFDLDDNDNTDFLINFKDASYLLVENALINIQRKYVSEGAFKVVEIQKTDENGNAVGHFDVDGIIYSIIVTKFGEILGTFTNIAVICDDSVIGDCKILLKASNEINPLDNLEDFENITFGLNFDDTARTITLDFIVKDGTTKTVSINSTNYDRFGNDTVCSTQLTSSSGTMICNIPLSFGNATVITEVFVDGNIVVQKVYSIDPNVFAQFGDDMGALVIIMMMTIPFMVITSTIGFLIAIAIGLIMATLLMLFSANTLLGVGSSIVWLLIAIGILIYKISKRGTL